MFFKTNYAGQKYFGMLQGKHSAIFLTFNKIRGGSICNENPFITPSTNVLGLYALCQTKDQSVAIIMVHETLFHLSKFNKLQTFFKSTLIYTAYIFLRLVKTHFNKLR